MQASGVDCVTVKTALHQEMAEGCWVLGQRLQEQIVIHGKRNQKLGPPEIVFFDQMKEWFSGLFDVNHFDLPAYRHKMIDYSNPK